MVACLKRLICRQPGAALRSVADLCDTPHAIALGMAIGLFIGLTPTVGIQMALVLGVAWICRPFFRFNRVAALMAVYVSNPLTMVPLYFAQYQLGRLFVAGDVTRSRLEQILHCEASADCWQVLSTLCVDVGAPLLVGTLIMSVAGGLAAYPLTLVFVTWYQKRRRATSAAASVSHQADDGMALTRRPRIASAPASGIRPSDSQPLRVPAQLRSMG